MEFNEKLQELRKQNGLTQEELAELLYVSRTAISKWESGRGYPSIDSLKAIAKFFSVTVDELLSSDEILDIAEKDGVQKVNRLQDLVFGLIDISALMLIFLPIFADRSGEFISSTSLLALYTIHPYLKITFLAIIIATVLSGVLILALQGRKITAHLRIISLAINTIATLTFILTLQAYAAILALVLLIIKGFMLIKRA